MRLLLASLISLLTTSIASAAPKGGTVSFAKQIQPLLRANCVGCHNTHQGQAGLALDSFARLMKGTTKGSIIAPGKSDKSEMVAAISGPKPKMPPGGPLPKEDVALITAWINQGAKNDGGTTAEATERLVVEVPKVPLKIPVLPQVAALAYSKDGKSLAVGLYREVRLIDVAPPHKVAVLGGCADVVHDVEFSPDGKFLAAAGGPPAQFGEIKIWDVAKGECVRTIQGHTDFIYSVAWSPDSKKLASASYDKLVKIWEVDTGKELKTLKDHADAVYAVAWSPKGNWIATGSADRSIKVWDADSGKRLYTISGHGDIVYSLAFNHEGTQLTSTSADKTIRTWNLTAEKGDAVRNITAHNDIVSRVVYSASGKLFASASQDKTARVFNAANGATIKALDEQPEAIFAVAVSPDDATLAVGSYDGSVKLFKIADGKLADTLIDLPKPVEAKKPPAEKKPGAAVNPHAAEPH
jgi:WD40 repeat protein